MLQCVAVQYSVVVAACVVVYDRPARVRATYQPLCSVLQCVAVYCSVLQCVAVCRSVLQCVVAASHSMRVCAFNMATIFFSDMKFEFLDCMWEI